MVTPGPWSWGRDRLAVQSRTKPPGDHSQMIHEGCDGSVTGLIKFFPNKNLTETIFQLYFSAHVAGRAARGQGQATLTLAQMDC